LEVPGSLGDVKVCEYLGEFFEGPAEDLDVVGLPEVVNERRFGREVFEVVRQHLASAASSFPLLHAVEEGLEEIVGAGDDAEAASDLLRSR
jgi:hypothetical protein